MSARIVLTADEAIDLLAPGEFVHNYGLTRMMIGADWTREQAIDAITKARNREIAGPMAHAMGHALAIEHDSGRYSVFATDMEKVAALETARAA